jgi:uncharacterized repeat protein (TIGR03843 family)
MDAETKAEILRVLQDGAMEIEGVLPWSSNYAFLVTLCQDDIEIPAVYKPRRGERPLWDFPQGTLSLREQSAFLVSEQLNWDLVPPTALRRGEHGPGSVQYFVSHDPDQHYFTIEGDPIFRVPLQKMALLDVVINNADRKGGHVIVEHKVENGAESFFDPAQIWGIDHGICFHEEYKLRTVIWEFAGEPIPPGLLSDLRSFADETKDPESRLSSLLSPLLSSREISALVSRVDQLVEGCVFPDPGPGRHYPWPPV